MTLGKSTLEQQGSIKFFWFPHGKYQMTRSDWLRGIYWSTRFYHEMRIQKFPKQQSSIYRFANYNSQIDFQIELCCILKSF